MKERTRRLPRDRKDELLSAALTLAEKQGYMNVSRAAIAAKCDVSEALLSHHFGTMAEFRRTLMRYAIQHESLPVVLQGIVDKNRYALKAPEALKARARAEIAA